MAERAVVLKADDRRSVCWQRNSGVDIEGRDSLCDRGNWWSLSGFHAGFYGQTHWVFEGQEIFRRAVTGMGHACSDVLARTGLAASAIDLVIPHQANLRIIEAVAKRAEVPMERVFVNVQRYGNMSAATVPVALVEALEEGRVQPGAHR